MALLLIAGALAGLALVGGHAELSLAGALTLLVSTPLLALVYRACEPLEAAARRLLASGRTGTGRVCAMLFGLLPMLALVALQIVAARLLARPAPPLLAALWFYAIATGPATLLAALAGRERRTLWSIRAYAGHLAGWIWLALGSVSPAAAALLALLPAVLPVIVGALIALTDPDALRSSRL